MKHFDFDILKYFYNKVLFFARFVSIAAADFLWKLTINKGNI